MKDEILISLVQAVEEFRITPRRLRAWVESGRLVARRRSGRGRGGAMFFFRGDIAELVYGNCHLCGSGFVRSTLKQEFCSTLCRQRAAMIKKRGA